MKRSLILLLVLIVFIILGGGATLPLNATKHQLRGKHTSAVEASVEWICQKHPQRVTRLFASLDLDHKGMGPVKTAVEKADWSGACRALLSYYRESTSGQRLRREPVKPGKATDPKAENILRDVFTFHSLTAKVPRRKTGGLDWADFGPKDDVEWGTSLNRHTHLRTLLGGYFKTGNLDYVRCIDAHVRDWILSNPYSGDPYAGKRTKRLPKPALQWYDLEPAHRVLHWMEIFYALQKVEALTPATRILLLSSLPDHGHFLNNLKAKVTTNHSVVRMNGLAALAVGWPEFKDAPKWLQSSILRMTRLVDIQVYPDGAYKELASDYHWGIRNELEVFSQRISQGRHKLPDSFVTTLEKMNNYAAFTIRPDGYGLLNNDSDRRNTQELLREAAKTYNRPDWLYISTNGREGKAPEGPPSVVFPWAGQMIMRSGWDSDAHWAFFDIGPWGTAHQHDDKLHLSIAAFGRDLLVDGGYYTYKKGAFRRFFCSSAAHNVILIDGYGQEPGPKAAAKALAQGSYAVTPAFDYARGSFTGGFRDVKGTAIHTRALVYLRGGFWVVVDRIVTDRPRTIQALWHYHPACAVTIEKGTVTSGDPGQGNLRIMPVSDLSWKVNIVKGQTEPSIQGWWSEGYNMKKASPTAVYTTSIDTTATFAWVLVAARGAVPQASAQMTANNKDNVRIRVKLPGEQPLEITIPLKGRESTVELAALVSDQRNGQLQGITVDTVGNTNDGLASFSCSRTYQCKQ